MNNKLTNLGFMILFAVAAVVLVVFVIGRPDESGSGPRRAAEIKSLNRKAQGIIPALFSAGTTDSRTAKATAALAKETLTLIKSADIRFQVRNLAQSRAAIEQLVKEQGGYIVSDEQQNEDHLVSNTLVIRIPAVKFEAFNRSLKGQAIFLDTKTVTVEDVTAEYIDHEARLGAKRQLERRYLEILQQAGTVKEILEVEARLGTVREEIEALEGKLRFLQDRVSYSTVTLAMYQRVSQLTRPDRYFGRQLTQALANGWKGFLWATVALTTIWPLVFLLAGIGLLARQWRRRRLNQG